MSVERLALNYGKCCGGGRHKFSVIDTLSIDVPLSQQYDATNTGD